MEKRIQKIILSLIFIFSFCSVYAQVPSFVELIRIPLWAELDAYPESEKGVGENIYSYPVRQLKKTAPFIISGMVYGWDFVYVPSDKARGVEEYFEITEIQSFVPFENAINYTLPEIESTTRLNVWCEYKRDSFQIQNYQLWSSIQHPVIKGRGYGEISLGFEGFTAAVKDAIKNGLREHYRTIVKNKPKEITGSILIKNAPTAGVVSGRYVINLDFFLEYGRIIQYNTY